MLGEVKEGGRNQREKLTKRKTDRQTDRDRERIGAGKSCSPDLVLRTGLSSLRVPAGVTLSPRWVQQSCSTALVSLGVGLGVGLRAHRAGRQGGEMPSMDGTLTRCCSSTGLQTTARTVAR